MQIQLTCIYFEVAKTFIQNFCLTECLSRSVFFRKTSKHFHPSGSKMLNRIPIRIIHKWSCLELRFEVYIVNKKSKNSLISSLFDKFISHENLRLFRTFSIYLHSRNVIERSTPKIYFLIILYFKLLFVFRYWTIFF
jgi:hypothetical protein